MKIKVWKNIIPDGETLFRKYWEEMGDARSLVKMRKWCIAEGYVHKNGTPATKMAIWFKMWRWALKPENQKKAQEIFNKASRDVGEFYTDTEWKEYLDSRARCSGVLTPHQHHEYFK